MASQSADPLRRALVRGAAWSVPVVVVASAAPAFGASPCSDTYSYRLDWGTTPYVAPASTTTTPNVGTATVPALPGGGPGASAVTVTFTSALAGTASRYTSNLTVLPALGIGGLGANERGLAVRSNGVGTTIANRQTVTIGFSRAVSGLSFSIVDLDRDTTFWDRVSFNPVPTSYVRAATVAGIGEQSAVETTVNVGAFRYTGGSVGIDDTSGAGNVQVNFAGSTSSLQLIYWSAQTPGPQGILVSDLTFSALGC